MSNDCNLDYNEIFTKQLFQTLGQLVAALMTTSLAVPVYSFYTRGYMFYNNKPQNSKFNRASDNNNTVSLNEETVSLNEDEAEDEESEA